MAPEVEILKALSTVSFPLGTWDKRFVKNLDYKLADFGARSIDFTHKQTEWLYRLLYKYRKQVPNTYEKFKEHEFCKQKENQLN